MPPHSAPNPGPETTGKAIVSPITDDNCHVMKLSICGIYKLTLTMFLFL